MLRNKVKVKKNDKVKIISGKDRGKIGKVLSVDAKKDRVLVENINMMKHHKRPNVQFREGGIVEKEVAIMSKAALYLEMDGMRIAARHLDDGEPDQASEYTVIDDHVLIGKASLAALNINHTQRKKRTVGLPEPV